MAARVWYWAPSLTKEAGSAPGGAKMHISAVWPTSSTADDIKNSDKSTLVKWVRAAGAGVDGTIVEVMRPGAAASAVPQIGDDVIAMPDELGKATSVYTAPRSGSSSSEGAADSVLIMGGLGVLAVFLLAGGSRR